MNRVTQIFDIYIKESLEGERKMMLAKAIFDQLTTLQKFKFLLQRINPKVSKQQYINNYQILIQPKKYMSLVKAAGYEDGIVKLSDEKIEELEALPLSAFPGKFIPMSGAASRMFGFLNEFLKNAEVNPKVEAFIKGLTLNAPGPKFAFVKPLIKVLQRDNLDLSTLLKFNDYKTIVEYVLEPKGLNYKNLPKALIYFHLNEKGRPVLALEEHMIEALRDTNGQLSISISPEHKKNFLAAIKEIKQINPALKTVNVSISYQDPSTDSIAIDPVTKKIILDALKETAEQELEEYETEKRKLAFINMKNTSNNAGKTLVNVEHAELKVGESPLISDITIQLIYGDRIVFCGNNGSGKTSILDSLFWCLTDETMSGRTGDSVIRKKTGKNCSVILEFDVVESGEKNSYIVENYRKHKSKSDLKLIYKNGEKILGDNPSRKDANAFIEQIISPKDILLNCLVLSQFVKNNFIDMNHSGQKGILDTILQLDQYDTYLVKCV
jgi:hypothetical protein